MRRPRHRVLIVVYSRIPGCGPAMTRLRPFLSARDATRLQRACLLDTLDAACAVDGADVALAYAPPARRAAARAVSGSRPVRCMRQSGRTLGERLEHTIADARRRGYERVIVLGSDSPTLPAGHVPGAIDRLDRADVVLGPADDGGFYLLASRIALPRGALAGIPWSTGRERAAVERSLRARGLRVVRCAPWYDIDQPRDLKRAERDARHMRAALRTARVLRGVLARRNSDGTSRVEDV